MEKEQQVVQDEMRKLIKKSCASTENINQDYYGFHKALLKFYFGAVDVNIDYDEEIILLWNSKPKSNADFKLYDINEAVASKVSYSNLEETLKGCLESGEMQNRFYRTMLFHYNQSDQEITMPASA